MSFAVEMPIDKESAKRLLSKFMENATNIKYKKEFNRAVELVYGKGFDIKLDLSNRMCFTCEVCHKDMNNVKSLVEHSQSGSHIKLYDSTNQRKKELPYKSTCKSSRSLQSSFIQRIKNSSVTIIGLKYLESYDDGRRFYYKCNLCGAHGKADSIYNHIIGDKHTDNYIKITVKLEKVVLDQLERYELRTEIAKRDYSFTADDIVTIKGRSLFPYMWESECHRSRSKKRNEFDFDLLKARANPNINPRTDDALSASSQKQYYMSYQYFDTILLKFNAILQLHLNEASDLHTPKDLRFCMTIHFYILHLLFYVNRNLMKQYPAPNKPPFLVDQNSLLTKALGCHRHKLSEYYNRNYAKDFGELPVTFKNKE